MKRYPKYKDSGIKWIGEIPDGWEVKSLKFIAKIVLGKMLTNEDKGEYFKKPYLRAQNIMWEQVNTHNVKKMWFSEKELSKYRLSENDLLVSEGGEVGRTSIWKKELGECYIQNSVHKVTITSFNSPNYYMFHFEFFGKTGYFDSIVSRVSIAHLTREKLKSITFIAPPIKEQSQISNYLDHKTKLIDTLIDKKQKQIELLKEQRTAIINQAVTKGLDPNVKMKNSGIEWLGEIPESWEVKPLKFIANIVLGKMLTNDDKGGYFKKPYLRAQNIMWEQVNISGIKEMWFSEKELSQYLLEENDLLVSEGGEVGRTAIWKNQLDECYIQNSVHKVSVNIPNRPYYFLFQFELFGTLGHFDAIVNRVSIAHLTREKIKDILFIVPPINDQESISEYLIEETQKIDGLIDDKTISINLLKEYRTTLISEAVTGKIDVRENNG